MEQNPAGKPVEGGLVVSVNGIVVRHLAPGSRPLTFGRAEHEDDHLHLGRTGSGMDRAVSRIAGSIRWQGHWSVRNESTGRPFVLIVDGQTFLQAPRSQPWPVGPQGVRVEVVTPTCSHSVELHPVPGAGAASSFVPLGGDSTTPPLPEPTAHDRLLLGAKFLSGDRPGDAIGNAEAAERINGSRPRARPLTARAVENVVRHWRDRLEAAGVQGISGRNNIDELGRQLLAWKVLGDADGPAGR